jgi:hypothetical protein
VQDEKDIINIDDSDIRHSCVRTGEQLELEGLHYPIGIQQSLYQEHLS